jgi:hypothetical protein
MSIGHLDILNRELPELFQPRDLAPNWHESWIFVSVDDPERTGDKRTDELCLPEACEDSSDWMSLENMGADLVDTGGSFPDLSPLIVDILGGAHAGGPLAYHDRDRMPPPDCLAFYLPFHYYHPTYWGVYLLFEGVVWLAGEIVRRSSGMVSSLRAMQAARLFLYPRTSILSGKHELRGW